MYAFCISVFAPVQRNLACFTWKGALEIRSLLLLLLLLSPNSIRKFKHQAIKVDPHFIPYLLHLFDNLEIVLVCRKSPCNIAERRKRRCLPVLTGAIKTRTAVVLHGTFVLHDCETNKAGMLLVSVKCFSPFTAHPECLRLRLFLILLISPY